VVLSPDGEVAIEEIGRKSFDLIISDWYMPKMDDLDFFKALSKNREWNDIPFLLTRLKKSAINSLRQCRQVLKNTW
jgi:CheY-like chemotaxis protein